MIGIRVRITVGIRIRIGLGLGLASVFVAFAMKRDVTRYATLITRGLRERSEGVVVLIKLSSFLFKMIVENIILFNGYFI